MALLDDIKAIRRNDGQGAFNTEVLPGGKILVYERPQPTAKLQTKTGQLWDQLFNAIDSTPGATREFVEPHRVLVTP